MFSIYTGCGSPIILFFVPDGHSKESPITALSKQEITKDKSSTKDVKATKENNDKKKNIPKEKVK